MKVSNLILLTVMAAVCSARAHEQVYCGRRLALAWAMQCDDQEMLEKRSMESDYSWMITPHKTRALGRGKRNIVMECCEKPCSVNELKSYC